jgi:competence protein ComEC
MFFNAITFLSGIMLLQDFSSLPTLYVSLSVTFLLIIFMVFQKPFLTYLKLPALFILGFVWCAVYANIQSSWILPDDLEGKTLKITGIIDTIPVVNEHLTTFLFSIQKIQSGNQIIPAHGLVHLSWQDTKEKLKAGDKWEFSARLKKIHGNRNPGGFDYEAWSLQAGIRANGYIYHDDAKLIHAYWYQNPLSRIRQHLYDKIIEVVPPSRTSPWIAALAVGIRNGVNSDDWQVLRNTGTNHLMAIAGLHIGFMSSFMYALVNALWRRIPLLTVKWPAQHAGAVAGVLTAIGYSALAGFSLPTQRACLMLVIFFIISLFRRQVTVWHGWSMVLFLVLFINPLSVLTESFWLSFSAVALIIYGLSDRLEVRKWWSKWGRIQWVLTLGLIPLNIWFFQECSLISIIANVIAIPFVGFIIVPCVLLGCFMLLLSSKLAGIILLFSDKLLNILWGCLTYLSHLSWAVWYHAIPSVFLLLIACIGVIILLLPAGFPGRGFGLIFLFPFLLYQSPIPQVGDAWFTLLDVGQGLSAVIQTQKHLLVFDTGAHLSSDYDMGESVVLPFLRSLNTKKIDMLIVSHRDNDHSGGAKAIINQIPVLSIKTSSPELFSQSSYCLQHEHWQWDGVDFAFLYPTAAQLGLDNDSSCVLRISTHYHQILLPGDIEKSAEKYLVSSIKDELQSDILIAPHHGSKTSAVNEFIEAVHPKVVLFPVGYRNRYHFPNQAVLNQYKELNVGMYNSGSDGAIRFELSDKDVLVPELFRSENKHYWNYPIF